MRSMAEDRSQFDLFADEADSTPEPKPSAVPAGAAKVEVDGNELDEKAKIALSANQPGPNYVPEVEDTEVEAVEETVKVAIASDAPVDEAYVSVPGVDPDADYVSVDEVELEDSNGESYTAESARIKLSSSPVELPVAVGVLVAETPYAEVVR